MSSVSAGLLCRFALANKHTRPCQATTCCGCIMCAPQDARCCGFTDILRIEPQDVVAITPGAATPKCAGARNPAQCPPTAQPICRARCAALCQAGRSLGRIAGAPLRQWGLQADRSLHQRITVFNGDRALTVRSPCEDRHAPPTHIHIHEQVQGQ